MARKDRFTGMRWRVGSAAAGVVGALAYLAQIIVGFSLPLWLRLLLSAVGTVLLFFSVALPSWQVRLEVQARKAALATANQAVADYDVKLHKVLIPLSGLLAQVVAANDSQARKVAQGRFKQAVVDYAIDVTNGTDPRSSFYEYQAPTAPKEKRKLTLDGTSRGRNTRPRPEFVAGDDAGNEALRILDQRETVFYRNTDATPPPGWRPENKDYNTYIQVAVANGQNKFGLLAVDAVNPGDLTDEDKRLIELLAQLLSCALAIER